MPHYQLLTSNKRQMELEHIVDKAMLRVVEEEAVAEADSIRAHLLRLEQMQHHANVRIYPRCYSPQEVRFGVDACLGLNGTCEVERKGLALYRNPDARLAVQTNKCSGESRMMYSIVPNSVGTGLCHSF